MSMSTAVKSGANEVRNLCRRLCLLSLLSMLMEKEAVLCLCRRLWRVQQVGCEGSVSTHQRRQVQLHPPALAACWQLLSLSSVRWPSPLSTSSM